ncbi:CBO0543 family protein [Bacillus sp. HMF5848]|uniref:CBO0543 family protein n=1 Tax=Bacillus sp. HMF5848 TaxID=2495421 RepID=UPI001639EDF6|nr:CBO0543 family protein [Bacillus sp. HMF5848]
MTKDKGILVCIWAVTIVALLLFIPKDKVRHGVLAFLYKQIVTWLFGLVVVDKGLIAYPIRIFSKANKSSFSFEYFFYPSLCAIFNIHYPEGKSKWLKGFYYLFHAGFITLVEVCAEKYTNLIQYKRWSWYWSFLTIATTYYSSRLFYRWFFAEELNQIQIHNKPDQTPFLD